MKIIVDENIPMINKILLKYADVKQVNARDLTKEQILKFGAEALFVRSTCKCNSKLLDGTGIKFLATATAGTDHFDWNYLENSGIHCTNAPGANSNSVAEYVIFCLMHWAHNKNISLKNKNFGIIGFGAIGSKVAYYAHKLGMNILVNDSILKRSGYKFPDYVKYSKIPQLFVDSDAISNHIPLTFDGQDPTEDFFNRQFLGMMKPGALFIHSSRGKILNEDDAYHYHIEQEIELAIDVWKDEPEFDPDLVAKTMIATPHIGAYSHNGKINGTISVLEQFAKFKGISINLDEIHSQLPKVDGIIDFNNQSKVYEKISESRKIIEDDKQFRKIDTSNLESMRKGFDDIRKNYPIRYEYLHL